MNEARAQAEQQLGRGNPQIPDAMNFILTHNFGPRWQEFLDDYDECIKADEQTHLDDIKKCDKPGVYLAEYKEGADVRKEERESDEAFIDCAKKMQEKYKNEPMALEFLRRQIEFLRRLHDAAPGK